MPTMKGGAMNRDLFEQGLKTRREVLGSDEQGGA